MRLSWLLSCLPSCLPFLSVSFLFSLLLFLVIDTYPSIITGSIDCSDCRDCSDCNGCGFTCWWPRRIRINTAHGSIDDDRFVGISHP